jgi:hypothetical protein
LSGGPAGWHWSRGTEVSEAGVGHDGGVQPTLGSTGLPQATQDYRAGLSPLPPQCLGCALGLRRAGVGSRAQPLLSGDHGPQRGSTVPLKAAEPDQKPWLGGAQQFMLRIALASLLPPWLVLPKGPVGREAIQEGKSAHRNQLVA